MTRTLSTILLQVGVIAVVVVATPYKLFELDRYFVPKELALHAIALALAILLILQRRELRRDITDSLLVLFIAWSAGSAIFATNHWLAQRALGLSVSSAIVFWSARRLGRTEAYRGVLAGCAVATVLAAVFCLLQAYGVETEYFSTNRAPGGTFGNRNFVAHMAVIGLPALVWSTVTARRSIGAFLGSFGVVIVGGALVLSRSRAAWLALGACALVLLVPMLASRKYWSGQKIGGRFARLALAAILGGIIAIVMPNSLNWNSDSPYLDSARGMVDYKQGSGRGRIEQYRNSLKMAISSPILGVGPGNWPVQYTEFSPDRDPSIASDGMTANPWPSSDWVAYISERGVIPTVALLAVFAFLFFGALRHWRDLPNGDAVLAQLVLAGTVVTTMVVSAFDAVLLLAAPAFLAWTIVGVTSGLRLRDENAIVIQKKWSWGVAALILVVAASLARSLTETVAMSKVGRGGRTSGWVAGAAWDPGSYRINVRVAAYKARRGSCTSARTYARRARALFPHAPEARRIANGC